MDSDPSLTNSGPASAMVVVWAVMSLIPGVLGLPLTLMLLIPTAQQLRKTTNADIKLSLVVMVFDMLSCIGLIVFPILILVDRSFLYGHIVTCDLNFFLYIGGRLCSTWFIPIVAAERFVTIVFHKPIRSRYWFVVMVCVSACFVAVGVYGAEIDAILPVPLGVYCFIMFNITGQLAVVGVWFALNWLSIIVVVGSYLGIMIYFRQASIKNRNQRHVNEEFEAILHRITVRVLCILVFYIVTNGWEACVVLYELAAATERTPWMDLVSTCLQNWNPIANSLLLLCMNREVYHGFECSRSGKFLTRFKWYLDDS